MRFCGFSYTAHLTNDTVFTRVFLNVLAINRQF
jgi:hypothetical protein